MSSFIQLIKMFISGNTLKGIKFRTDLSIILIFSVLTIEIAIYYMYWNSIPNMIKFAWETAMLFVTTEQGYIFALIDIIENRMCDDIVTIIFLFWEIILILEFRSDLRILKANSKNIKKKPIT